MRSLLLFVIGMSSVLLFAITDDISNQFLQVKCNIVDSTQTIKDSFFTGEPITYSLTILNIELYSIDYRSSSNESEIATINVISIADSVNHVSSYSATKLDSLSTLQPNDQIFVTKTVIINKPGKYEFVVIPHFKFPYDIWPYIGPLDRIFYVIED
jgi:hypothetical protein